jgi:hypothetical protein
MLNGKKACVIQTNVIDPDAKEPIVPDTSSLQNQLNYQVHP